MKPHWTGWFEGLAIDYTQMLHSIDTLWYPIK